MTESDTERKERFDALFAAYRADVVGYCGWRAASTNDAQDATAEVFLTAWRRLDGVPEGDAARIWLYATARRVLANQRRSSRRRAALRKRLALEAESSPREPSPHDREEALVHEALGRLRTRSPAEIAGVLGRLTVTARGKLHRARRRFQAVFEELLAADGGGRRRPPPTTSYFAKEKHEHV
jgi:DNA-directed RNA polymerase specialized sigma24 family protein